MFLCKWLWYVFYCPLSVVQEERSHWISQLKGVSLSSDAFFPFRDNIDRAVMVCWFFSTCILIMATVMLKCFMFCASIKVQKNLESSHHSGTCLCCKIQLLCWTMCKSLLKFLELLFCALNPPVCYISIFDIIIWTFCIFKFGQHIKYWYPFKMFWYQRLWVCLFCPWIIYIPVTFKIRGCLY